MCHIIFVLIPQPWYSHQQPVFCNVWHMSYFRITIFETEFMSLSYPWSCIKKTYILYYSQKFVPHLFLGQTFYRNATFCENLHFLFQRFPLFIFKYRPVYMTEATLNANNYINICSIPSIYHMYMYDRWWIFMHKISQAYIVLAYGKPFITELFE